MRGARAFAFGSFLLIPQRQLLLHGGVAVRIGCRALDLLTALVQHPGELMTKGELMAHVWPTTTVGEGNLKVAVAALRRALNDDADAARYIATVTGRGYRFIAPVGVAGMQRDDAMVARDALDPSGFAGDGRAEAGGLAIDGEITLRLDGVTVRARLGGRADRFEPEPSARNGSDGARRMLFIELDDHDEGWIRAALSRR